MLLRSERYHPSFTYTATFCPVPRYSSFAGGGATATVHYRSASKRRHGVAPPQPHNSFYQQNHQATAQPVSIPLGDTLKTSFDWLTHLDRQLISPMELLNVPGVKPHELTHYFQMNSTQNASDNPSKHLAPWSNQNSRLARFFEFVTTANRYNGIAVGGRVPGKININTLGTNDKEVFRAAVDVQPGNGFFYPGFSISSAKEGPNPPNRVTITTSAAHNFVVGQSVQISGVGQPAPNTLATGYNGTFTIATVPSPTTFTYTNTMTGLTASSGGVASQFRRNQNTILFSRAEGHAGGRDTYRHDQDDVRARIYSRPDSGDFQRPGGRVQRDVHDPDRTQQNDLHLPRQCR